MKSSSGKLALAVAAASLFTSAAYAQMSSDTAPSSNQGAINNQGHPSAGMAHHAAAAHHVNRHAYHTGTAHATALHNHAAANTARSRTGAGFYDVYNAAVLPTGAPADIGCIGGGGPGYYPNPVSYDESAFSIIQGGEFTLERGYPGCFSYFGQ